jgi:serine/threonine-protein kinase
MIDYEIAADDPKAAQALVASLPSPPPALVERVAAAERAHNERNAERVRMEALGRQHDDRVGRRTRLFLGTLFGSVWTCLPLVGWALHTVLTYRTIIYFSVGMMVMLVIFGVWARDSMTKTRLNRGVMGVAGFIPVVQILIAVGNQALGISPADTLTQMLLLWSILATAVALSVERKLVWSGVAFAIGWLIAAHRPELTRPLMSFGNLTLTVLLLIVWRPRDRTWREELLERNPKR